MGLLPGFVVLVLLSRYRFEILLLWFIFLHTHTQHLHIDQKHVSRQIDVRVIQRKTTQTEVHTDKLTHEYTDGTNINTTNVIYD